MRHGLTMAPVSLVVFLALVGAGPESTPGQVTVLDERFGSRTAPILLLARPDIQRDLQLNPRQIAGAKETTARLIERALSLRSKSGPAVEDERRRIDEEMMRWFSSALSETQLERLRQINVQWEGAAAMTRPHVVDYLKLADSQRFAVNRLLLQCETDRRDRGGLTPQDVNHFANQARGLLSTSQKDLWDRLHGPPCRFTIGGRTVTTSDAEESAQLVAPPRPPGH